MRMEQVFQNALATIHSKRDEFISHFDIDHFELANFVEETENKTQIMSSC